MTKEFDWADLFDEAYKNALVYGTGFIKITVNGPEGVHLSVVEPRDYMYIEPIKTEEDK
jgi:hypothetical protein